MKFEMISRVFDKKETQKMVSVLKSANLPIRKIEGVYSLYAGKTLVFKAAPGKDGYLVRYAKELFIISEE